MSSTERQILGVVWFSGRSCVGIVRVRTYDEILYYIGVGEGQDEDDDVAHIADWGSSFPDDAGDVLFGVNN